MKNEKIFRILGPCVIIFAIPAAVAINYDITGELPSGLGVALLTAINFGLGYLSARVLSKV